ncbi:acyl-CoA thioesterase [Nitzschia inconspicua]|uniref:Acyl-CoA thioesterase n=1 Tax=Nitzschia inconspicua TaxID=303405 RepID=A0A9K3L298_9STRA|nr:acyl-CoA thioesterase [Nitzschia inconspicua]
MWQTGISSLTGTLHVLRLVCTFAATSSAFQQQFQQQQQNSHRCLSDRSLFLGVQCDNSPPPAGASLDPPRMKRMSVLSNSPLSSSETMSPIETSSNKDNPILGNNDDDCYEVMTMPTRGQLEGHAIFGTLHGETMIEQYQIWKRKQNSSTSATSSDDDDDDESNVVDVVIGLVTFGSHLNGHPTLVHGGILSLIFDDICGFAYEAVGVRHAVTANLNVDYRAPVPAGSQVRVAVQLERREGRKLFWKAQMKSLDQQVLYAEATSLYIIPREAAATEAADA